MSHRPYVLVVHGGAGTLSRISMTKEKAALYSNGLRSALCAGLAVLERGGSSMDAVTAAVATLEDDPLFNAGRGSVLTADGVVEMDAAVMDGASGNAGAVAGVRRCKNPIHAARAVMSNSKHVVLVGEGADLFAASKGVEQSDVDYFIVPSRKDQLDTVKAQESAATIEHVFGTVKAEVEQKFGTVGAVALDIHGNLAAATSTGGMTNKRFGRVGDSPIIGAGTFASNSTCAVSCTGHGEYFIRNVVAHTVSCRLQYEPDATLNSVAEDVVMRILASQGGEGGLIAVDRSGGIVMPYNCEGMYRGYVREDGKPHVFIFDAEEVH